MTDNNNNELKLQVLGANGENFRLWHRSMDAYLNSKGILALFPRLAAVPPATVGVIDAAAQIPAFAGGAAAAAATSEKWYACESKFLNSLLLISICICSVPIKTLRYFPQKKKGSNKGFH